MRNLCESCRKGQLEMCDYFRENFLEREDSRVVACPEYEEDTGTEDSMGE